MQKLWEKQRVGIVFFLYYLFTDKFKCVATQRVTLHVSDGNNLEFSYICARKTEV